MIPPAMWVLICLTGVVSTATVGALKTLALKEAHKTEVNQLQDTLSKVSKDRFDAYERLLTLPTTSEHYHWATFKLEQIEANYDILTKKESK